MEILGRLTTKGSLAGHTPKVVLGPTVLQSWWEATSTAQAGLTIICQIQVCPIRSGLLVEISSLQISNHFPFIAIDLAIISYFSRSRSCSSTASKKALSKAQYVCFCFNHDIPGTSSWAGIPASRARASSSQKLSVRQELNPHIPIENP